MVSRNGHPQSSRRLLSELADLYGVVPEYLDSRGQRRVSPSASVYQVLEALGAELGGTSLAGWEGAGEGARCRLLERAIRVRREETWARPLEPLMVFWDGRPGPAVLRLPSGGPSTVDLRLVLEGGEEIPWRVPLSSLEVGARGRSGRRDYLAYALPTGLLAGLRGDPLPPGRHVLRIDHGRTIAEAVVLSAPRRCWRPADGEPSPWGLFVPAYALRTDRDWGAGDLADLALLGEWVAASGGDVVATLPLLASYLEVPFEPSPYRPVSRLFWNEFYLAPDQIPEWERCPEARKMWSSPALRAQRQGLRAGSLVDYGAVMRNKRSVLERLCGCFFQQAGSERRQVFADFLRTHPEAPAYAAFRARVEAAGGGWRSWPAETGTSDRERYHLYCQWQMEEQLRTLSGRLLLDIPVGVHPGGYDASRWPELFANGMSMGAPPDAFFAHGQDWECFPAHPGRDRERGYEYFASYVAGMMRHAAYLRIDHVMALHRLFWIPEGDDPGNGVYVTYPAEELYAVLCLESHRHRTAVVGEDLGTVPAGVRSSMRRHGVLGTWVLQLEARARGARPVPPVPRNVVAAVNTHDLFPFAGFLRGDDIEARLRSGQADPGGARRERAARRRLVSRLQEQFAAGEADPDLLFRVLGYLVRGRPALTLVSLEDLLGATLPQNRPGIANEPGNWGRKLERAADDVRRVVLELGRRLEGAAGVGEDGA